MEYFFLQVVWRIMWQNIPHYLGKTRMLFREINKSKLYIIIQWWYTNFFPVTFHRFNTDCEVKLLLQLLIIWWTRSMKLCQSYKKRNFPSGFLECFDYLLNLVKFRNFITSKVASYLQNLIMSGIFWNLCNYFKALWTFHANFMRNSTLK